ncbi:hypothetical protein VP01_381g1 [Puccinia sorghi]|uniref:Uncharacterized protein n=1 Tax=Puccinia sorghi TaxID=27349 RepID=A0A0L6UT85_9BASI|nr:hypothetical protein VP01_381g1 [Puccinia sorghi]
MYIFHYFEYIYYLHIFSALCMKKWYCQQTNQVQERGSLHTHEPQNTTLRSFWEEVILESMFGHRNYFSNYFIGNKGRLKWGGLRDLNSIPGLWVNILSFSDPKKASFYIPDDPSGSRGFYSSFGILQFILCPHDIMLHCIVNYTMCLSSLNRMNFDKLPSTCQSVGIPFILRLQDYCNLTVYFSASFLTRFELCENLECTCISYSNTNNFIIFVVVQLNQQSISKKILHDFSIIKKIKAMLQSSGYSGVSLRLAYFMYIFSAQSTTIIILIIIMVLQVLKNYHKEWEFGGRPMRFHNIKRYKILYLHICRLLDVLDLMLYLNIICNTPNEHLWCKIAPLWCKMTPLWFKMTPLWFKMTPLWFKMTLLCRHFMRPSLDLKWILSIFTHHVIHTTPFVISPHWNICWVIFWNLGICRLKIYLDKFLLLFTIWTHEFLAAPTRGNLGNFRLPVVPMGHTTHGFEQGSKYILKFTGNLKNSPFCKEKNLQHTGPYGTDITHNIEMMKRIELRRPYVILARFLLNFFQHEDEFHSAN